MTDVIYMSFTNMHGETRLDVKPTFAEVDQLSRLKVGGSSGYRVNHIDFGAKRPGKPPTEVWVRVVCQTADPLTEAQRAAIRESAEKGGRASGVIV